MTRFVFIVAMLAITAALVVLEPWCATTICTEIVRPYVFEWGRVFAITAALLGVFY